MYPYQKILESAGFEVSEPHDPTPHSIYRGKLSRYTITLGKYSYDNMLVSETSNEKTLLRHFFTLFTQQKEETQKYKELYERQLKENERIREHATRILYPTTQDEPINY